VSIRLKRLQAEYDRIVEVFAGHERIRIAEATGSPPDRYVVEYRVNGLVDNRGAIESRALHRAEIVLGRDYPRELPRCRMLTPVFHPNIDHLTVCTQDFGSAGESLVQLIVRVGEMISFQAYNTKSPRNGEAARWTEENLERLPLERVDLMPQLLSRPVAVRAEPVAPSPAAAASCGNCGATAEAGAFDACAAGHLVCPDCIAACANCRVTVCVLCSISVCSVCGSPCCQECVEACGSCGRTLCLDHFAPCAACATQANEGSAESPGRPW
jgi:ubiquitin-protein ligase